MADVQEGPQLLLLTFAHFTFVNVEVDARLPNLVAADDLITG